MEVYGFSVSEGKLSRVFGAVDVMESELESILVQILIGTDEESAADYHDTKGASDGKE